MSVRAGVGFAAWPFGEANPQALWRFVDQAEALGIDSLWVIDRIVARGVFLEPMTVMAAVAARTRRLKFGPSVLALSLRNPVLLAKEIATVDFLSGGRILPVVGLGLDDPVEAEACGIRPKERAGRTDEAIEVMRRLWTEDDVTHEGRYYRLHGVTVQPKPAQKPCPPIWIGGTSDAALRRVARLGDGWLASTITPAEVAQGLRKLAHYLKETGRQIEEDHIGVIIPCCIAPSEVEAQELAADLLIRRRSDVRLEEYTALGPLDICVALVRRYLEAGASKFVLRLACPPDRVMAQLELLGRELIPRVESS